MREYKFRVWNKKYQFMDYNEDAILKCLHSEFKNPDIFIMQYTGLNDKDGKEIYENDLLEVESLHSKFLMQVIYYDNEASFNIPISQYNNFKIIGNIYENTELLEKK